MVPEALAGRRGRRGARIPPHSTQATRRTAGLEAAVVDHAVHTIQSLDESDRRSIEMKVAGPAALLVAKLHKLGERQDQPDRLIDKDAHDLYRLLVATDTHKLAATISQLKRDELAGEATTHAIEYLRVLFADGPDALGAMMAGRAEQLVGEPAVVSAAAALAADLLAALHTGR